MIKVDNITRKYGDNAAVDRVSFEISPGEIVGLLGHNGAGKTTIMKMMTGYLEPTGGNIFIDNLDISANRQVIQQKIGYLPENCPVYPEMSVLSYLEYCATLHGVLPKNQAALIQDAISRTGLAQKATDLISTLSRGYRQRTGVAQALLHKPGILILDEPTNGLDPTQIQQMRSLIEDLSQNATIIISTHILQEVQAVCDRVIIIKDGTVAMDSRLDDLQHKSKLLVTTNADNDKVVALLSDYGQVFLPPQAEDGKQTRNRTTFELLFTDGQNNDENAAAVAKTLHDQGLELYGLHFEARNLETVFAEISG